VAIARDGVPIAGLIAVGTKTGRRPGSLAGTQRRASLVHGPNRFTPMTDAPSKDRGWQ